MRFLDYEEQAIIKMQDFSSKEELKDKLQKTVDYVEDEYLKNMVKKLIDKIDNFTLEELKSVKNVFE